MPRWQLTVFGLASVAVVLAGCSVKSSPGGEAGTSHPPGLAAAFLTAVDVDVLEDHTLVTLQSDSPLRYVVRRDDSPARLIIDLPAHRIAPGVRALEVFRGGITLIQPRQSGEHGGSQVEIGLGPAVSHSWSAPFPSTLLVEVRPESSEGSAQLRRRGESARGRAGRVAPAHGEPYAADNRPSMTIGQAATGNALRATAVTGIVVEPLDDRTRVRVVGDGPILVYKTSRPSHPRQFALSMPSLATDLAGQRLERPTAELHGLTIHTGGQDGATLDLAMAAGVVPKVARDGPQLVVDLASAASREKASERPRSPQLTPVSTFQSHLAPPGTSHLLAQAVSAGANPSASPPVYTGQRISLDFQQADLIDVLRLIAEVSGMNIITSPEVSGRVTTRMVNVPWDQALDTILKTFALGKDQEGSIIRVAPLDRLRKERDDELQSKRIVEELEPPITRTLQLNYARAEELKTNMEKLLTKQGRLDIDKRTNTIIIKDVSATVEEILELIRRLDSQTRQVSIDTRIVETNRTFLQELGVRWGGFVNQDTGVKFPRRVALTGRQGPTPVGGNFAVDLPTITQPPALALGLSLISNSSVIDMELQALERNGRGRIISNPKVVTLDNKEALIESGDEVPFKTETAQTGPAHQSG
jgi:hypothetical protein